MNFINFLNFTHFHRLICQIYFCSFEIFSFPKNYWTSYLKHSKPTGMLQIMVRTRSKSNITLKNVFHSLSLLAFSHFVSLQVDSSPAKPLNPLNTNPTK